MSQHIRIGQEPVLAPHDQSRPAEAATSRRKPVQVPISEPNFSHERKHCSPLLFILDLLGMVEGSDDDSVYLFLQKQQLAYRYVPILYPTFLVSVFFIFASQQHSGQTQFRGQKHQEEPVLVLLGDVDLHQVLRK
jgi:hypothetical protein